jgi:crotonobetainyl-CoA:carnitine CoA-transferase CaiB-like acyl-CoA transferase
VNGEEENTSPLAGVRVIDLTHHIAGPNATKLLADYGADVIKIERPDGGDPARRMAPFLRDEPHIEKSGLFLHLNTNKRSVTLDLKTNGGRALLLDLVRDADILVESFAPRVMPSLGLSYETVREVNTRIVMTSLSNFGQSGPYRDYKMTELTLYALGGTMHSTGTPDREPVKLALTVEQFFAGMITATATMGAYLGAQAHGAGQHVDLSLFEMIAGNQDRAVQAHTVFQYAGTIAQRAGGGGGRNVLPSGVYPVADGYVQFFALQPIWDRFCRMIDREDLIEEEYFTRPDHFSGNATVKAEVDAILYEWLLPRTKREVMEKAQSAGYFCGAINSMEDVFNDPHLAAREFFAEVDHPVAGTLRYPGPPFKMTESPWRAGRAPLLGEHTLEVLGELGYSAGDVTRLREQGVL